MDENKAAENIEENIPDMDMEELIEWFNKLSGRNAMDESNSGISYQMYSEGSDDQERIYTISRGWCRILYDKMNPVFIVFDMIYRNGSDPELRLLWDRLESFGENLIAKPDLMWVFYMNVVDAEAVRQKSLAAMSEDGIPDENDNIMTLHLVNPFMWCLTKDKPGSEKGENMIRMLFTIDNAALREEYIDIATLEAEAMRYDEADRIVSTQWNET